MLKRLAPEMSFDMFSSNLNAKFKKFMAREYCPGCTEVNAFNGFNWANQVAYCFPPFSLIGKCLNYVVAHRVPKIYFMVPWQRTAVWFPKLQELMVGKPLLLPKAAKLLTLPFPTKLEGHPW